MKKQNKKKGFTLVELLVVIAILAILATVSVVGYTSFIQRANESNAKTEATQIRDVIMASLLYDEYYELTKSSSANVSNNTAFAAIAGIGFLPNVQPLFDDTETTEDTSDSSDDNTTPTSYFVVKTSSGYIIGTSETATAAVTATAEITGDNANEDLAEVLGKNNKLHIAKDGKCLYYEYAGSSTVYVKITLDTGTAVEVVTEAAYKTATTASSAAINKN